MFIKQFKIKSNIQFKASEKKKFRTKIVAAYPNFNENDLNELLPSKASLQLIKVITHNQNQVTVYSVDKKPMFFEVDDKIVPTVYTLWKTKDLVPSFTTHPQVFPKLTNGADLMLPGVVRKETTLASWGRFEKDQVVLVNLTSNYAAVGVGLLARSSEDLYMSAGQGICVKMLHVYGDKLWSIEPTVCEQLPVLQPVISLPTNNDFPSLEESLNPMKIKNENIEKSESETINMENLSETFENVELADENNTNELVEESMDDKLKKAFLTALKLGKSKLILPLLTSNFYRLHILTTTNENIDIKLTSYKKVSKFLDAMSNQGFLTLKEESKGVEKITDIDFEHPELLAFIPNIQKNIVKENDTKEEAPLFTSSVSELLIVTPETEKFFSYFKIPVGRKLEKKIVLNYIKDYVGQNKLKNDKSKIVVLNNTLKEICCVDEVKDVSSLNSIISSKMDSCYEITNQSHQNSTGKVLPIKMSLATRSSNKKVTLIDNLDQYGIIISEFVKACKLGAAASTSITRPPGSKSDQLLVQGNQIKFIYDLLTQTYKIPPKNITGLEFAKKEKKKK